MLIEWEEEIKMELVYIYMKRNANTYVMVYGSNAVVEYFMLHGRYLTRGLLLFIDYQRVR